MSLYNSPKWPPSKYFCEAFVKLNKWFEASAHQTLSADWYKYAMISLKTFKSQETTKMVYSPYFHFIKNYELIFWWNSSHSATIIKVKKNKIEIITGSTSTYSYRYLFTSLNILPLQSQYTVSLLLFVFNNKNRYRLNPDVYNTNTT
jgi:hypothetical protein